MNLPVSFAIEFQYPLLLWITLLPLLLWVLQLLLRRRQDQGYAQPGMMQWALASRAPGSTRSWRLWLTLLAWSLFAVSLAGPRQVAQRLDLDGSAYPQLMLVLDLSRSMTARDLVPDRLQRARLELLELIRRADRLRMGLVVYAAQPHLVIPPSSDKSVLRHQLQTMDYGVMPSEGSDLRAALAFAAGRFAASDTPRAILLISDGELVDASSAGQRALDDTLKRLREQRIPVYTLGVGSESGAPVIAPEGGWLQSANGAVTSRLQAQRLRMIAQRSGGIYHPVSDSDADWNTLYDQGIAGLQAAAVSDADRGLVVWRQYYAWFAAAAALCLFAARFRFSTAAPASMIVMVAASVWLSLSPSSASAATLQDAYRLLLQQDYAQARKIYASLPGYDARMGEASSAYFAADYQGAAQAFHQAVIDADTDRQRATALFNLANSYYRLQQFALAERLYRDTLLYQPAHPGASMNLEFAVAMQQRQLDDKEPRQGRPGNGWRYGKPPPGTDVSNAQLSIDEQENTGRAREHDNPAVTNTPTSPQLDIRVSRPASYQLQSVDNSRWQYATTSAAQIQGNLNRVDHHPERFWKRLFEIEEQYPAPLQQPRVLPGVDPW